MVILVRFYAVKLCAIVYIRVYVMLSCVCAMYYFRFAHYLGCGILPYYRSITNTTIVVSQIPLS